MLRVITPVLFAAILFSCQKKQGGGATITDIVAAFPVENITESVGELSPAERDELLKNGESANWKLSVNDVKNDEIVIKNKTADDNTVRFIVYRTNGNGAILGVQQVNAQSKATNLWQWSPDGAEAWTVYKLPSSTFEDFIAEGVTLPETYKDKEATGTPFLDIGLSQKSMTYAVNKWNFLKEVADYYKTETGLETSYIKYQWEWVWNGTEFQARQTSDADYDPAITVTAVVVEEEEGGPSVNEFDCPHGVSVSASAELSSSDNRYQAANILDEKDETAWAVPNGGVGKSITFTITENFHIGDSYQIRTGYTKSKDLWKANNRVKKLKVFVKDQLAAHVILEDSDKYQGFSIRTVWMTDFFSSVQGDQIRFEIEEIYKGDKYDDTLISYFVPTGNCG